ncbi:MAG: 2-oxo acid dehydrogenase subunit E2 [Eubacteriales bacterium]|nr:2-oxo acid dehydrogenase subunit E2 [Eubacteriales bacterium]
MNEQVIKLSGLHKAMSRQMVSSWSEVPQFQLETEVDCSAMIALRKKLDYHPSYTSIIARSVADALHLHPMLNASWRTDHVVQYDMVNIGIAADTKRGLLVPVIRDVAGKPLHEIDAALAAIKEKSAKGNFSMEDLADGTFTVSNLGMFRINAFASIVNAPQAAILAIPRMTEVVCKMPDGSLGTKMVMRPVLSIDHRVTDGASGARFINDFVRLLEDPEVLL